MISQYHDRVMYCEEQSKKLIHLFRMIVLQGLMDVNSKTKNKIKKEGKEYASTFFDLRNEYFVNVCKVGGLKPAGVMKIYRLLLKGKINEPALFNVIRNRLINVHTIESHYNKKIKKVYA